MRKGISYTMTLAVVGVVLVIAAVLVTTMFSGSLDNLGNFLGGQNTASEIQLCDQRVSSFCSDNDEGANWARQFPNCGQYSSQIDADGNTVCPLADSGSPTDNQDNPDNNLDNNPDENPG